MIISFIIIAWTVVLAENDFGNDSDACILRILTRREAPTVRQSEDENMLGNDGNILGYDLGSVLRRPNLAVAIPFCWWRFHQPCMVCFGRLWVFVAANFGGLIGVGLGIYSVRD